MADEKKDLEAHYTPPSLVAACLAKLPLRHGDLVLEPHLGQGAFAEGLLNLGCRVLAADIDPQAPGIARLMGRDGFTWLGTGDFLDPESTPQRLLRSRIERPDWVIGNPPFSDAPDHVEAGLAVADRVAFVLPIQHHATKTRRVLLDRHPITEWWAVEPRPSFNRGGTGRSECMWAVWLRGWPGPSLGRGFLDWDRPPLPSTKAIKPGGVA